MILKGWQRKLPNIWNKAFIIGKAMGKLLKTENTKPIPLYLTYTLIHRKLNHIKLIPKMENLTSPFSAFSLHRYLEHKKRFSLLMPFMYYSLTLLLSFKSKYTKPYQDIFRHP